MEVSQIWRSEADWHIPLPHPRDKGVVTTDISVLNNQSLVHVGIPSVPEHPRDSLRNKMSANVAPRNPSGEAP